MRSFSMHLKHVVSSQCSGGSLEAILSSTLQPLQSPRKLDRGGGMLMVDDKC